VSQAWPQACQPVVTSNSNVYPTSARRAARSEEPVRLQTVSNEVPTSTYGARNARMFNGLSGERVLSSIRGPGRVVPTPWGR